MNSMGQTANRGSGSESLVGIVALVLLSTIISTAYVMSVHYFALQGRRQNAVEQAALLAIEEMSLISTDDPRFGRIGLCDRGNGPARVLGINTLMASLRLDLLIAEKQGLRNIASMVTADLEAADIVRAKLREQLLKEAFAEEPAAQASGEGTSIWSQVGKVLDQSTRNTGEKLTTYSVSVGHLTKPMVTITPAPDFEQTFAREGSYLSGIDIALPHGRPLRFTEIKPRATFVDPKLFTPEPQYLPPSVVRVTATFDVPAQGKDPARRVVRTACVVLGARYEPPEPASLLISFPFGAPPQFKSLRSLLGFSNWTGSGTWLQSQHGPVPGNGHLSDTTDDTAASVLPQSAIQMAFYHWLLQCGPALKLDRVRELLDSPWPLATAEGEAANRQNSALTHDTGARSYAVINQSGPGGTGQQLLSEAFRAKPSSRSFPASALPLFIDQEGNCNLPGRQGLDRAFVLSFINDLYETNLSSIESHNVARTVLNRMNLAIEQQLINVSMEKEELHSIDQRLSRLRAAELRTTTAKSAELLQQENLRKLKVEAVERINQRLKEHEAVRDRARLALRNADTAWLATWEIGSKLNFYTKGGLHRVGSPVFGYLLSGKQVFIPQKAPISEDDIYAQHGGTSSPSLSAFLSAKYQVLVNADEKYIVEGLPLPDARQRFHAPSSAPPSFFAWTSAQLSSDQKLETRTLRQSPFDNSGIATDQLAYLAANALRTGQSPEVAWSLLIRDEVAYKGRGRGEPVLGHQGWCSQNTLTFEQCPGLACEIQMRAPLPILRDLPAGPSVTGPGEAQRVSLIPPTPLSML
jgi:hypothetical protein